MAAVAEVLLYLVAALTLVPMAVLVAESLAALLPGRREADGTAARPRCVVLVPAHDEEAGVGETAAALLPQLNPGDRLLVVADNCGDRTAEVARASGATVVERHDPDRRGKGYALDFGVRSLRDAPPDVVVVVDADCRLDGGALDRLVRGAASANRPVQGAYVLDVPPGAGPRRQLSAFAFVFKNVVRPLGLRRLGQPCLLTGTGMAFPWPALRDADLASGNIVEDMKLGVDLALAGHPPTFCPGALVRGELPSGARAAAAQRTRWEHGHLQTLLTQVPRLVGAAFRRGRPGLLGLALELSVPPLSMLFLLWAAAGAVAGGWWAFGGPALPALLLAGGGLAVLLAILAAWLRFGREVLPPAGLLAAPVYVLGKVPIYLAFVFRRQRAWVRTERDRPAPTATPPGPGAAPGSTKSPQGAQDAEGADAAGRV
jgi:cellulose synthase/poly-beta-1,6-N-acetylglucosamine synthase-like glycosyltransferase